MRRSLRLPNAKRTEKADPKRKNGAVNGPDALVTPPPKKPAATNQRSTLSKSAKKPSASDIKRKKDAADDRKAERARLKALQEALDKDEDLEDEVENEEEEPTVYGVVVKTKGVAAKEGDERLWTSVMISPEDPRNEKEMDKLREYARLDRSSYTFATHC